jgi:protoheme IX farnesyltransferase
VTTQVLSLGIAQRLRAFLVLTKPRVVSLIVFTAVIGMLLAAPALPPLPLLLAATLGIGLVAGAAAAFNCLVEQKIDAVMARTRGRPTVTGTIPPSQVLLLSGAVGGLGLAILWHAVNPLTMWLTLATFVGYAVIYTVILKPATPQNIVIGGASGAMPPVLGWAAVAGDVTFQPLLLFLIIFAWTPPHFWALALYRKDEYARAGVPMLPVTHGDAFTRLHLLLYTLLMVATTLLPFASAMAGYFYLGAAAVLDLAFLTFAVTLWRRYSHALARRTFAYSIFYLAMLFAALMVDHYLPLAFG